MLILLDLNYTAVLEAPAHHVGLAAGALDVLGLVDGVPELVELGQLDVVPDMRERRADDGALNHLVGSGDVVGSHNRFVLWLLGIGLDLVCKCFLVVQQLVEELRKVEFEFQFLE